MTKELEQAVAEFMIKQVGRAPRRTPGWPTEKVLLQRLAHLAEELGELSTAVNKRDLPALADALGDLMWIAQGLALDAGVPLPKVLEEIKRSNDSKDPLDPVSGKGGKGANFSPPSFIEILMAEGWPGPELPFEKPVGPHPYYSSHPGQAMMDGACDICGQWETHPFHRGKQP
jgi:NTP pyrophosphatase (non-canonical NTP hydrolase)